MTLASQVVCLAGRKVQALARISEPWQRGWRWLPIAVLIGSAPFAISLLTQLPGHQLFSAILLAWVCLASVQHDDWRRGMAVIAMTFFTHCACVITAASYCPGKCIAILPEVTDYWQKQQTWITTGVDPEYELSSWITRHLALFGISLVWSFATLGIQTFQRGFFEVDLMNFYTARLMSVSHSGTKALLFGWHIWSLLRGAAFVILTYEVISLAVQFWTSQTIATWTARRLRWLLASGLLVADGLAKHFLMEVVRQQLQANLDPTLLN